MRVVGAQKTVVQTKCYHDTSTDGAANVLAQERFGRAKHVVAERETRRDGRGRVDARVARRTRVLVVVAVVVRVVVGAVVRRRVAREAGTPRRARVVARGPARPRELLLRPAAVVAVGALSALRGLGMLLLGRVGVVPAQTEAAQAAPRAARPRVGQAWRGDLRRILGEARWLPLRQWDVRLVAGDRLVRQTLARVGCPGQDGRLGDIPVHARSAVSRAGEAARGSRGTRG